MIPEKERDLLIKLMGLTTSDHDGEALSAIRKANVILNRHKTTWREFLGQDIRIVVQQQAPTPAQQERMWREMMMQEAARRAREAEAKRKADRERESEVLSMLEELGENATGFARKMSGDMLNFFEERGYLSDKQKALVRRIYREWQEGSYR